MVPIQELLHRIEWDPAWKGSSFEIGYVDRLAGGIVRVPFESVRLESGTAGALILTDEEGVVRRIPLHRVHEVWRDGALSWKR